MTDIVDPLTRSRMMAGIKGKNTRAEVEIRKHLFSLGFRYRIHDRKLPGKPDIVLPRYKAVIFIHGCFWHAHDCYLFKMPSSRSDFWKHKLKRNKAKDTENFQALVTEGWRVLTIWECAFRGPGKKREQEIEVIVKKVVKWLNSKSGSRDIRG